MALTGAALVGPAQAEPVGKTPTHTRTASASVTVKGLLPSVEIRVKTRYSDKIRIKGYNQYNEWVISPWFKSPSDWTLVNDWWWRKSATVRIEGVQTRGNKHREAYCTISNDHRGNQFSCDMWSKL